MRPTISPTSPRSTASGLQRTSVRSAAMGRAGYRRGLETRPKRPLLRGRSRAGSAGGADEVERAGDHDLAVRRAWRATRSRSPRPTCRPPRCARLGKPSSTAASAITAGSSARGFGGRAHTSCATSSSPSASASRAAPPRAAGRPRACAAAGANSSASASRSACAPATLCAPSSSTSGCRPTISSRPGERTRVNASYDRVGFERRADERLRGRERDRRVVALVRAVQRDEHVGVARRRGVKSSTQRGRRPRARWRATPKSTSRRTTRAGSRSVKNGTRSGSVSPSTSVAPVLDDPGLLRRDLLGASVPRYCVWSMLTFVTTATSASITFVASHVPPRPTSTTATSTATSANQRSAAPVTISKYDGSSPSSRSTSATDEQLLVELVVGDRLTVADDALVRRAAGAGSCTRRPSSPTVASSSVIMRVAVVLPFVPVRWIAGYSSCGEPRYCSSVPIRSSVGAPRRACAAGTPTPVSRLTCASSQRAAPSRGRRGSSRGDRVRRARPRPAGRRPDSVVELGDLARLAQVGLGAARARRAARRCRARRPCVTGVVSERFCSDFALRTAASTSPADLEHERIAAVEAEPRHAVGHAARWIDPVSNHDHTSSVTNGMIGANRRSSVESAVRSATAADARLGLADAAVRAALHELDVVVAERPEEALDALERTRVVERVERRRSRRRRGPRARRASTGRARS